MKCPNCKEPTSLLITERRGVEIDYCPECRGVWLDRGELDKILAQDAASRSEGIPAQPVQQSRESYPPPQDHLDQRDRRYEDDKYRYKHKRKKSFLEELFD